MDKDAYLIDLAESANTDFGRVSFSEQSEIQKVFSAIWGLESQVNNGGFLQYFRSSDGDAADFAPTALRRIGAMRCAAIVEQALRSISAGATADSRESRISAIKSLGEPEMAALEKLDKRFLAYPDNLNGLLFEYVHAHPEEFGGTSIEVPHFIAKMPIQFD